ncbi:PH domain-containing protein [Blastococcus sp. TF02-8]|uniref:PH domain-containing protein n=1 Tax=Blastococcus sp. TF02-8 TaxID=2250574 RepID=UPI0014133B6F|nr:PH domain-containing protein [Blastococcus sp. TF02-8]
MSDASWLPDPGRTHELRYWNGSAWTEHVSDQGRPGQDPPPPDLPPPGAPLPPPPPPAAAPAASGKGGWRDRLKQVADQGKALADQGKAKLAEQNAKRTEQWANDPSTLWFGESRNAATSAAGISKARYRITKDRVWIESGLLGTRTESVPLWAVKDIDVRQAVWQRGNDVGDVVLTLEDASYAATTDMFNLSGNVEGTTTGQVVLDNIESPYAVVDLLSPLISEARQKKTVERQSQYLHVNPGMAGAAFGAPAAPPPTPAPQPDLVEQLRKLGELRDAGILTEEEFAAQKAKVLG